MRAIPTATPPAQPIPAPAVAPALPVPSIDELYRMTAHNERAVIRGVDWGYYERLLAVVGERNGIHLAYDGKDLEINAPGPLHEDITEFSGELVKVIAEELGIRWRALASTTWKRPEIARGIEADQCYYFLPEKLAQAAAARKRKSNDVADYPNPDLAIEIDLSASQIDRPGIYAALGVTEVWRFDATRLNIERLNDDGTFTAVEASGFLPVRADEVAHWVLEEDLADPPAWKRRLRAWIRTERGGSLIL
jgi:Uma2 family endonuclease